MTDMLERCARAMYDNRFRVLDQQTRDYGWRGCQADYLSDTRAMIKAMMPDLSADSQAMLKAILEGK